MEEDIQAYTPFGSVLGTISSFLSGGYAVEKAGLPRSDLPSKTVKFRLLHTNDVHSTYDLFQSLSAMIQHHKVQALQDGIITVVTDAGDFFSGSIAHTLGPRAGLPTLNPELDFLMKHGTVFTLGNHEWDATQEGLATMVHKLSISDLSHSGCILASNIILNDDSTGAANALKPYFFDGVVVLNSIGQLTEVYTVDISDFTTKEISVDNFAKKPIARALIREYSLEIIGSPILKIGYIGVLGPGAMEGCEVTRKGSGVEFQDYHGKFVKEYVAILRQLGAEVIICLCHGGSQPKGFQVPAEDEILAQNIPGIDIIAAGHTHYGYKAKRVINDNRQQFLFQSKGFAQLVMTDLVYTKEKGKVATIRLDSTTEPSRLVNRDEILSTYVEGRDEYKKMSLITDEETKEWTDTFNDLLAKNPELYTVTDLDDSPIQLMHDTPLIDLRATIQDALIMALAPTSQNHDAQRKDYELKGALGKFVTTAVCAELNVLLKEMGEAPAATFFTVLDLIRTDFPADRPTVFADVFAMLSRGVMRSVGGDLVPDGGRITVTDMKKRDLYHLIGLVEFYARNVKLEATMAYSHGTSFSYNASGIPIFSQLKNLEINGTGWEDLPPIIRVAMPTFIAQNFRDKAGGAVNIIAEQIDPTDVESEREIKQSMDVLLAQYLRKYGKVIQTEGLEVCFK